MRLFANGSEGAWWRSYWCDRCTRDMNNDCSIFGELLLHNGDPLPEPIIHRLDKVERFNPPTDIACLAFDAKHAAASTVEEQRPDVIAAIFAARRGPAPSRPAA